jgi:hypothetical protein
MNDIERKAELMEVPVGTRKDEEGIELLIHLLGHPNKIISIYDAPPYPTKGAARNKLTEVPRKDRLHAIEYLIGCQAEYAVPSFHATVQPAQKLFFV